VDPIAKVLDFGLAKMTSNPSSIGTTVGRALGTPAYMSPEQLQGKPLDGRSGVFAAAVVFYEALTGRRPWKGGAVAEISTSILRDHPDPLHLVCPEVPQALSNVVMRALEKSPAHRYPSADALRRVLKPFRALPAAPSVPKTHVRARLPSVSDDESSTARRS
jgi:serine/threonine-protein kinase